MLQLELGLGLGLGTGNGLNFLAQYIGACFGKIFPGESFPLYGTECLLGGCN